MKRVKPKMTHNDRFFFSQFCVGSSQELAQRAFQHERAISQLQVASENSLLCEFQFHTRCCWVFWREGAGFLDSFMSFHCIFKTVRVSESRCVTGRVTRKKTKWCCFIGTNLNHHFCKILQGHTEQADHWFISITSIIPSPHPRVAGTCLWHNAVLTH